MLKKELMKSRSEKCGLVKKGFQRKGFLNRGKRHIARFMTAAILLAACQTAQADGSMPYAAERSETAAVLDLQEDASENEASPTDAGEAKREEEEVAENGLFPCLTPVADGSDGDEMVQYPLDLPAPVVMGNGSSIYIPDSQEEGIYGASSIPAVYPSGITNTNISSVTGALPAVRDQGEDGVCWAYSSVGSAEVYGVKNGLVSRDIDLSETALAYSLNYTTQDPLGNLDGGNRLQNASIGYYMHAGANAGMGMEMFYQWLGPVSEADVPSSGKLTYASVGIPSDKLRKDAAHITSFRRVNIAKDREYLKKLIMEEKTAAAAGYYSLYSFYDADHASYCSSGYYSTNHSILIVGWNDDFPASHFKTTPLDENGNAANGAWLVRNSWGDTALSQNGYFWLSYYDPSLNYSKVGDLKVTNNAYVPTYSYDSDWDYNYQYDGSAISTTLRTDAKVVSGAAVFEAKGKTVNSADAQEALTSVSCEVATADTAYKIEVYRNPEPGFPESGELCKEATVEGRFYGAGEFTVNLASPVKLLYGESFSVVVTLSDAPNDNPCFMIETSGTTSFSGGASRVHTASLSKEQNYFRMDGGMWHDMIDLSEMNSSYSECGNLRIKAYTEGMGSPNPNQKVTSINVSALQRTTLYSGENMVLSATAYPTNAANRKVVWESSNPTALSVDANGKLMAGEVSHGTDVTITVKAADGSGISRKLAFHVIPKAGIAGIAHVQTYGWQENQGILFGTTGKGKRLEALMLGVFGNDRLGITYTTHVQTYGWRGWSTDGEMNGTSGEAKRLEALKIRLTGEDAGYYDVYYRVHVQHFGWMGWARNGEPAGTAGYAYRMEAMQIVVVPTWMRPGNELDGVTSRITEAYQDKNGTPAKSAGPTVSYQTHVQTYGWQEWKENGAMSGTEGEKKRLEGIRIQLSGADRSGGITYRTHVQTYGWQSWRSNGAMAGTSGEKKRLESIEIKLTGEMAAAYDVYYRVHAQHFGWMGWAKNGESAGTAGYAYRLEGIQVVLVKKGGSAPGKNYGGKQQMTSAAFRSK